MPLSRRAFLGASALLPPALPGRLSATDDAAPARPAPVPDTALKPPRLQPGDTVGIICPAYASWEPFSLDIAVESLAVLGLRAKLGAHVPSRHGYLAGTDRERADDLNAMLADPDVKAIHALRGGWGCARLLPLVDFAAMARHPKILLGYSDITALLLGFHARSGCITFHGPVGASEWNGFNVGYLKRVLFDAEAVTFANVKEIDDTLVPVENRIRTITPGRARGRLLGGNLTVLTAIVGSGYLPAWDGCILFIEDVEEAPYRIDRMLTQLSLAGILAKAKGVVFGNCTKCEPGSGSYGSLTIADVLDEHLKPLGVPAWHGAMIGHIERQFTLPVGGNVAIDATAGTIQMLEPGVA